MRRQALILALTLSGPAAAARIAVMSFTGPDSNDSRNQLVKALCEAAECVPQSKVSTGGKPDWKKAKQESVTYVVTGKVTKKGKKLKLDVVVLKAGGKPKTKKTYALEKNGRLAGRVLDGAVDALSSAMGLDKGSGPPPPVEPATPEPVAKVEPPPAAEPPPPEPVASPPPVEAPPPADEGITRREELPRRGPKQTVFIVEAGPDMFTRRLTYEGVETNNLRSYEAKFVLAPRVSAEVYPLALMMKGLAAGFGIEAGYGLAVGLKSKRSDGPVHPTSLTRLDVAAKLAVKPVANLDLTLVPRLGFRSTAFKVAAAEDGTVLDGLPGISYSALQLGAGVEFPVSEGKIIPFARFNYLAVLSSGEIISANYFPAGSASGIEAAAGVGYRVIPAVELRLTGALTRYGLSFKTNDGDTYIAKGAVDQYLGANLSARYVY